MDDLTPFEKQFGERLRNFAASGVRPVDGTTVAHAVALDGAVSTGPRRSRWGIVPAGARRAWGVALAAAVAVALVGGAIIVGSRLLQAPPEPRVLEHLVYGSDGGIFVADPDGANPVAVDGRDPSDRCSGGAANGGLVSPDGRHLAFRSGYDDGCTRVVDITDLNGHLLASVPGTGWDISWSPDSTRFATWVDLGKTIGIYGLDGKRDALLDGSKMCCGDYDPVWSPDGTDSVIVKGGFPSGGGVWEVPVDGSPARMVIAPDPRSYLIMDLGSVVYSPDRARVAIAGADHVFLSDPDGSNRRSVGPGYTQDPPRIVWSPSGDRIAYTTDRALQTNSDGNITLWHIDLILVDATSGETLSLASFEGQGGRVLGFSPDGRRLLYSQTDAAQRTSLWTINTGGSGNRKLVDGADTGAWTTAPAGAEGRATP